MLFRSGLGERFVGFGSGPTEADAVDAAQESLRTGTEAAVRPYWQQLVDNPELPFDPARLDEFVESTLDRAVESSMIAQDEASGSVVFIELEVLYSDVAGIILAVAEESGADALALLSLPSAQEIVDELNFLHEDAVLD